MLSFVCLTHVGRHIVGLSNHPFVVALRKVRGVVRVLSLEGDGVVSDALGLTHRGIVGRETDDGK